MASPPASQSRVLIVATRYHVDNLIPKVQTSAAEATQRWFNAALALIDEKGALRPFLADLPELNTDTWRVFPDGRMETTYRLRPGLTWHDGQPLSAEDFVFAWRVYTHPSLGEFTQNPQRLMESVVAADPGTLVITWRAPYPDANAIRMGDLDPLPRHLLDQPFANLDQSGADAFMSLPYWLAEYVGTGPYRLTAFEPGSHYEAAAFDGYVLGRPRIDRIVLRIIADENVALTNVLAGSVDFASLRFEHGQIAQRDWVPTGKGVVVFSQAGNAVRMGIQLRPEYAGHPAQLDLRVRRAIAHALDRQAINDGVFDGQGFTTETVVPVSHPLYPEVDRAVTKYPYDLRRTEQLMNEVGLFKGRDGFFATASGERFWLGYQSNSGSEFERTQLILSDAWQRAGIEVRTSILPNAQAREGESRQTFPGVATTGSGVRERDWTTAEIGTPENRWTGDNRGGWSSPEYDRLFLAFLTTLDRAERAAQFVAMQRLLSEDVPVYYTHFAVKADMYVASLHGPTVVVAGLGSLTREGAEPIHEWTFQ